MPKWHLTNIIKINNYILLALKNMDNIEIHTRGE